MHPLRAKAQQILARFHQPDGQEAGGPVAMRGGRLEERRKLVSREDLRLRVQPGQQGLDQVVAGSHAGAGDPALQAQGGPGHIQGIEQPRRQLL